MGIFSTSAIVDEQGRLQVGGVPFAPGTQVEVTISPSARSRAEFIAAWERVCTELRDKIRLAEITEDEINEEVRRFRAQR